MQAYYYVYEEHARTLKTWLVAYGVGALFVVATNNEIWQRLIAAPLSRWIIWLFIGGVAAQVIVSAINKASMWTCYYGEDKPSFKSTCWYRAGKWVSTKFIIDVVADWLTIVFFAIATYMALSIFLGDPTPKPEWVD